MIQLYSFSLSLHQFRLHSSCRTIDSLGFDTHFENFVFHVLWMLIINIVHWSSIGLNIRIYLVYTFSGFLSIYINWNKLLLISIHTKLYMPLIQKGATIATLICIELSCKNHHASHVFGLETCAEMTIKTLKRFGEVLRFGNMPQNVSLHPLHF